MDFCIRAIECNSINIDSVVRLSHGFAISAVEKNFNFPSQPKRLSYRFMAIVTQINDNDSGSNVPI